MKHLLSPISITWNSKRNGLLMCSKITIPTSLLKQEDQSSQRSILLSWFKTLVSWGMRLGIDTSWMSMIKPGSMLRKERKFKIQRLSPSILPPLKEKANFRLMSMISTRRYQEPSVPLALNSTSRHIMLSWEFDVPFKIKNLSLFTNLLFHLKHRWWQVRIII